MRCRVSICVAALLGCLFLVGKANALPVSIEGDMSKGDGFLSGFGDQIIWSHVFEPNLDIRGAKLDLYFEDDGKDFLEFGFLKLGENVFTFREIDTEVLTFDVDPQGLMDGVFDVRIISFLGDFYSTKAVLRIETNPASPVPEPAGVLLLGSGLVSIALLTRKRKSFLQ